MLRYYISLFKYMYIHIYIYTSKIFEKTSSLQGDSFSYRHIENTEVSTTLTTEPESWGKNLELLLYIYILYIHII